MAKVSSVQLLLLICSFTLSLASARREFYRSGRIFDITHRISPQLPVWESSKGLGTGYIHLVSSIRNGSDANVSSFKLSTHTGTHIDAPSHFYQKYYDAGYDVDSIDLNLLNGPVLLVDVPRDSNITAEVMKSLNIPKRVRRVLFRTSNTDRKLMHKKEFVSDYVGFEAEGAKWLVENTNIKLVGLDYLSVSAYDYLKATHLEFLKNKDIALVEGLNLDNVKAGWYNVHCLPLRLVRGDGCPTRCILIQ